MFPPREQGFRSIEPRLNPELMRGATEHGLEQPDEMKRRDLHLLGHRVDRQGTIVNLLEEIARADQPSEDLVPQKH
jgi:signal transduction histidine kinase